MGLMMFKKTSLLLLIISVSFLSTSFAAQGLVKSQEMDATHEEVSVEEQLHEKEATTIHERLLRVNSKDYGTYNPAPKLSKPRFKTIPN